MTRAQLLTAGVIVMAVTVCNAHVEQSNEFTSNTDIVNNLYRGIKIDLYCGYERPVVIGGPRDRSSIRIPSIYIDGHTLYFDGNTFEEIQLVGMDVNGNESIAYSSVVPAGAGTVDIPTGFTGVYEIRLLRAGYCFYGEIMI